MLTPEKSASLFNSLLNCPITLGILNRRRNRNQTKHPLSSRQQLLSFFNPTFIIPRSGELAKYRFILSHAPVPYTACNVYNTLWNLIPAAQLLAKEFQVKYSDILSIFNTFFPPWLRPEIKQMTVTRLDDALNFLQVVGWIRLDKTRRNHYR